MPLVTRYQTPAGLDEVEQGSKFYSDWHDHVNGAVAGLEGTAWIDPVRVDVAAVRVTDRTLSWIGFPRTVLTVQRRDDRAQGFVDADDAAQGRSVQFEYFEWHTTRSEETGKITKVAFSTETPMYFQLMADACPDLLLALYRKHVHPDVRWEELLGTDGKYDPLNRWTTTDGIMHFVNGINNLGAAIGLAQNGVGQIDSGRDNFEYPVTGTHAADDYIIREVAALGRSGFGIAVREPVGLYIDGWDDTGWTKPDGSPVGNYWRITRGHPGAVLRLEYEVPDEEGFVVGDILIGGRPVRHGGQLAEHMTSSLPVVVTRGAS